MRTLFAATGDIALPSFRSLLESGDPPLALITQPDKPVGRHQELRAPAIKNEALRAGIPVLQPERIGDIAAEISSLHPELMVVMAYGQILRDNILSLPGTTIVNLHASLLPRHRGAACIQAAIDAGDTDSGVTAMHVARALDAGDIIHARSLPISPQETGGSLHDRLADLAALVLADTLRLFSQGNSPRTPQDASLASHVPKLTRDHGRIDWKMTAQAIERRIRAYHPWPGTYTMTVRQGQTCRLKVFPFCQAIPSDVPPGQIQAAGNAMLVGCGRQSALLVQEVQPEGGRRMTARDYLLGHAPDYAT